MFLRYRMITVSIIVGLFFLIGSLSTGIAWMKNPDTLAYNKNNLIRLQVIANSDTIVDQAVKLKVRNRIIQVTESLLLNVEDPKEAEAILKNRLDELAEVATDELEKNHQSLTVSVQYGTFPFPEKQYPFGILPAGEYKGLKVYLGEGKGRNWWCVLYPPLCLLSPEAPTFTGVSPQKEPIKVEYSLAVLENWVKDKGLTMDQFWQGWSKFFGLI